MSFPGRKRASLILLLVLAASLAVAGASAAGAAGAEEMACCPAGMASGCTWLGASDCCPERPIASAPAQGTVAAPAACAATVCHSFALPLQLTAVSASIPGLSARNLILRL